MKTDRELLELAAKAAQIDLTIQDDGTTGYYGDWRGLPQWEQWNPLADDGDALRLAVKLGLEVLPFAAWEEGQPSVNVRNGDEIYVLEAHGSDPNAATRRAIVRAAAEIWERMP